MLVGIQERIRSDTLPLLTIEFSKVKAVFHHHYDLRLHHISQILCYKALTMVQQTCWSLQGGSEPQGEVG